MTATEILIAAHGEAWSGSPDGSPAPGSLAGLSGNGACDPRRIRRHSARRAPRRADRADQRVRVSAGEERWEQAVSTDTETREYPPEWDMGINLPGTVPLLAPARRVLAALAALDTGAPAAVIAAHADLPFAQALRHLRHLVRIGLAVADAGDPARYGAAPGPRLVRPAALTARGHAAVTRWRLGSVWEAARVLGADVLPDGEQVQPDPERPPHIPAGPGEAIACFIRERDQLSREIEDAYQWDEDPLIWRLGLLMLGICCFTGPWVGWHAVCERGLAAARREKHRGAEAMFAELAGKLTLTEGDFVAAREYQHQALTMRSTAGDKPGVARSLNALGLTFLRAEAWREAAELFECARQTAGCVRDEQFETFALLNLGAVHAACGEHALAVSELDAAITRLRAARRDPYIANALQDLALAHRAAGDLEKAEHAARAAVDQAAASGIPVFLPGPLIECARIQAERGHLRVALALLNEAYGLYTEIGDTLRAARTQVQIDTITRRQGATDQLAVAPPAHAPTAVQGTDVPA